jgi:hypothetical protein
MRRLILAVMQSDRGGNRKARSEASSEGFGQFLR